MSSVHKWITITYSICYVIFTITEEIFKKYVEKHETNLIDEQNKYIQLIGGIIMFSNKRIEFSVSQGFHMILTLPILIFHILLWYGLMSDNGIVIRISYGLISVLSLLYLLTAFYTVILDFMLIPYIVYWTFSKIINGIINGISDTVSD